MKLMDKNGDGSVSLAELAAHNKHTEEGTKEYFDLVDQNGDGMVNLDEAVRASEAEGSGKRDESFLGDFYRKWAKTMAQESRAQSPAQTEMVETETETGSKASPPVWGGACTETWPSKGCVWINSNPYGNHQIWGCCYPSSRGLWCRNSEWCIHQGCAWHWLYSSVQPVCATYTWHSSLGAQKFGWATANTCYGCTTYPYSCASAGLQPSCGWGVGLMCADPDLPTGATANGNAGATNCWNCIDNCG
jgi:hypothetical protein